MSAHDDDLPDPDPEPPSAARVARRALVLAAVSCRSAVEGDGGESEVEALRRSGAWITAAMLAALLSACHGARGSAPERTSVMEASAPTIILSSDKLRSARAALGACSTAETTGLTPAWTPTPELIARIDPGLRDALNLALRQESSTSGVTANDYVVQYLGVHHAGRPVLYANGIWRVPAAGGGPADDPLHHFTTELLREHAANEPIVICDGGIVRFTTLIDTTGALIRPIEFQPRY